MLCLQQRHRLPTPQRNKKQKLNGSVFHNLLEYRKVKSVNSDRRWLCLIFVDFEDADRPLTPHLPLSILNIHINLIPLIFFGLKRVAFPLQLLQSFFLEAGLWRLCGSVVCCCVLSGWEINLPNLPALCSRQSKHYLKRHRG